VALSPYCHIAPALDFVVRDCMSGGDVSDTAHLPVPDTRPDVGDVLRGEQKKFQFHENAPTQNANAFA